MVVDRGAVQCGMVAGRCQPPSPPTQRFADRVAAMAAAPRGAHCDQRSGAVVRVVQAVDADQI
eukprot:m.42332 g.42332  ORF g.42332 m.42332 type:complete len:63 (-) comp14474_c0_seq1:488-676(-)